MKKRVAFLINSFALGGAESVFISQINELYERGWEVHAVTLFTPGARIGELRVPQERVMNIGARSIFDFGALRRLSALCREHKIDVLYTTLNETNTFGRCVKIFSPRLSLVTREANMADIKPVLYKFVDIALGFTSNAIIAVSHAVADSLCAHAPWLSRRMRILYNGIQLPTESPARVFAGTKLLTVGSLTPKKDQAILIDAMKELPREYTLTIAGEGKERRALEARAASLGSRVSFLGAVAPARVEELYRTHDLFVLPSQREGCPNVVAEAQRAAMPVVAFDIPGMHEFVDEQCGALVQERTAPALAHAIRGVTASLERIRELGVAGFQKVRADREDGQQLQKLIDILSGL